MGLIELVFSGFVCLASLWLARGAIANPRNICTDDLAILFTGAFMGLGPWLSASTNHWRLRFEEPRILIAVYSACLLYMVGIAIGRKAGGLGSDAVNLKELWARAIGVPAAAALFLEISIWIFRLYVGARYGVFFSGSATSERMLSLPYGVVIIGNLIGVISLATLAWCALVVISPSVRSKKVVAYLVLTSQIAGAFLQGRRWLLLVVVFIALAAVINKAHAAKISFRRSAAVLGTIIVCLFLIQVFLTFRSVYYLHGDAQDPFEDLSISARESIGLRDSPEEKENNMANISARALFTNDFLCRIVGRQQQIYPMYGKAFAADFVWAIPSALFPFKKTWMATEQMIEQHYGLPIQDASSTWIAYGYADGGLAGAILVGCIFGYVCRIVEIWAVRHIKRNSFLAAVFVGGLISLAWNVESSPSDLWIFLRNAVLLGGIVMLLPKAQRGRAMNAPTMEARELKK
jgi:hypothetical protein